MHQSTSNKEQQTEESEKEDKGIDHDHKQQEHSMMDVVDSRIEGMEEMMSKSDENHAQAHKEGE